MRSYRENANCPAGRPIVPENPVSCRGLVLGICLVDLFVIWALEALVLVSLEAGVARIRFQ